MFLGIIRLNILLKKPDVSPATETDSVKFGVVVAAIVSKLAHQQLSAFDNVHYITSVFSRRILNPRSKSSRNIEDTSHEIFLFSTYYIIIL